MIYYLYVKTHNETGLKYLGKTIQDPFKYQGSGVRWLNHLKAHGGTVTTKILGAYETFEELQKEGLFYSKKWDIVKSTEWANLCEEDGHGSSGWNLTPEQRTKNGKKGGKKGGAIMGPITKEKCIGIFSLSKEQLLEYASQGGKKSAALQKGIHSPEEREKNRIRSIEKNPFKGKKHSKKTRNHLKEWHKGKFFMNNGIINRCIHEDEYEFLKSQGFKRGRIGKRNGTVYDKI